MLFLPKCALVLAYVFAILPTALAGDDVRQNTLVALQGKWTVVSSPVEEFDSFRDWKKGASIVVAYDRLRIADDVTHNMREKLITLGREGDPRQINLDQDEHAKGWSAIGIFRVRGDTLTLALTGHGNKRPTSFDKDGDAVQVIVLSRVAPKK